MEPLLQQSLVQVLSLGEKIFLLTLRTISTYIHELFPCELNNFQQ